MISGLTILLSFLFLIAYFIILKPLIPLLMLKAQLGEKAVIMFYPLQGFFKIITSSGQKYNDVLKTINDALKKNSKIVVILTNFLHKPFLYVTGPEYIKEIYTEHHSFVKNEPFMIPNFGQKGLVLSEGQDWKRQRRFLGGAFTFEKLKARIPMINVVVNNVAETDPKNNLNQFTSRITGEIVIQSFLGELAKGLQFDGKPAQVAIVEMLNDAFLLPINSPYILFKQIVFGFKSWDIFPTKKEKQLIIRVNNFKQIIQNLIKLRIEQLRNKQPEENMVFLDLYVTEFLKEENSNNKTISIEEIIDQFITLFFAGTDTTATLTGTCLYYLAQYPEAQKDIFDEVEQIIGSGEVKEEHLNKLEKINAFIQEVLRIRNPAVSPLYRQVRSDRQILDIKLKKGWFITQYHNAANQLDKHFDQAEKFDYKRWLTTKNIIKEDNGYIYVPFAAGQRNCIGQHMAMIEAKIIIAIMVRKFQILLNPEIKQIKFGARFLYCVEPDNCLQYNLRKL